ncbi:MAG: NAD(P)-dependent oxidoreductase [Deltaproteobacteria bacterium]|jgi:nucleoside-diphosphate-sugar epimerase|nr:NAD(P)-dependent oxidoreductase [Deltaproteobacteria bacterium]
MPKIKTLIAGGAGYLGLTLAQTLQNANRAVTIFDNLRHGPQKGLDVIDGQFILGDLRDLNQVSNALRGQDEAICLAALVGEPLCDRHPIEATAVNYLAAVSFARAAQAFGVKRFLFASTDSCYGTREKEKLTELSPLAPISLYASLKAKAEAAILALGASLDFQPTILRMGTLFGHSLRPRFDLAVNLLTREATLKKRIAIYSGQQWRPLVHVTDAARAYLLALEAPPELVSGQIFNVGANEQNVMFKDLGALIAKAIPGTQVTTVPQPPDLRDYWVSFDKIKTVLGFKIQTPITQGILEIQNALLAGDPSDPYATNHVNFSER